MLENQRALHLMRTSSAGSRSSQRRPVHATGTLSVGDTSYVAWVKDISEGGVLIYTKQHLAVGEFVRLTVDPRKLPSRFQSTFEGKVIRIQNCGPEAALGIAILFDGIGEVLLRAA